MFEWLKFQFKKAMWGSWSVTKLYVFVLGEKKFLVSGSTEIVIEGFPRCANTYAMAYFCTANQRVENKIAHHLHYPSQIKRAVKLGLPVILLIRKPADAILSLSIREGYSLDKSVDYYISFYKRVMPFKNEMVVADFKEIINDFSSIIGRVNERFGKSYNTESPVSEHEMLEMVENWNLLDSGGDLLKSSIPNDEKKTLHSNFNVQFDDERIKTKLMIADRLYEELQS